MRRWSGKEKEIVEVPCPEIVHQYNLHMGGVDKNDMLLSLYRLNTRTKKWYMHLAHYAIGISIANGWLIYRRHCSVTQIPRKNTLALKDFQHRVAMALLQEGKAILVSSSDQAKNELSCPSTCSGDTIRQCWPSTWIFGQTRKVSLLSKRLYINSMR